MIHDVLCAHCKHYIVGGGLHCEAFPPKNKKEIPFEIVTGKNDHSKPLKDQINDVIFEEQEE